MKRFAGILAALSLLHVLPAAAFARPNVPAAIVASADAGMIAGARPLAMPSVLAWPGGLGMPRVITWADLTGTSGIAWGTTSQITAANAYLTYDNTTAKAMVLNVPSNMLVQFDANAVNLVAIATSGIQFSLTALAAPAAATAGISYDGTNLILGVPTGKGFAFAVNGVNQFTVSSAGKVVALGDIASPSLEMGLGGATFISNRFFPSNFINMPNTGVQLSSAVADAASAVGFTFNDATALSTAGAKLLSIQNNTVEKFSVGFNGAAVAAASVTGNQFIVLGHSRLDTTANGMWDTAGVEGLQIQPAVADGASAVALIVNNTTTLSTAGAKLVSFRNNTTEKAFVSAAGNLTLSSSLTLNYGGSNKAFMEMNVSGHLFIGPSAANSALNLQSGSALGVRTTYAGITLNGIAMANGAGVVAADSTVNLQLEAGTGHGIVGSVNGVFMSSWGVNTTSAAITADNGAVDATVLYQLVKPSANNAVTISTLTGGTAGERICLICDTSGGGGSTTLTINNTAANTANSFRQPQGLQSQTVGNAAHQPCGCYVFGALAGEANNQWWAEW